MPVPILYYGSAGRITNLNCQSSMRLTSNKLDAQLYALVYNSERKNKGWSIRDGILRLRKDFWLPPNAKYQLNYAGYVCVFERLKKSQVQQNPNISSEWVSLTSIVPTQIEEVCLCDIPSGAIQYVERLTRTRRKRRY